MSKSEKKLNKLLKEGNTFLKKNSLTQALSKFKEAQRENPNNATINKAVSKINTKIKQSKKPKAFFERYTSATPGTIQLLENEANNLRNDLKDKEERLKM